jgi:hypothetical protein
MAVYLARGRVETVADAEGEHGWFGGGRIGRVVP